jgi:hypothetical protein
MDESAAINRCRRAVFRQMNGRFEQLRPWQATVFAMGQLKRSQHPGRTHGAPADLCLGEGHRLAVGLQEQLLGGAGRGGFAPVVSAYGLTIPEHDQRATTDARGLRFDQRQNRLHGNGGIDGRATATQHLASGFGSQWVGGCGHVA